MVGRILILFQREIRGLHEAAYLLGAFALLSQLLALLRDRLLAYNFGAGETLDIYYAAFRIPDLIFVSIASLVSLYVLIPFLSDQGRSKEEQRLFLDRITSFFTVCVVAISAVAFIAAPALLQALFPGLASSEEFSELVLLTRILLLQPIFLGLSNIAASITQLHGRFLLYAVSPLFYNAGIIIGVVFLYPLFGVPGLAYGVVGGAFLHLAVQLPSLIKSGFLPRLTLTWKFFELRRVLALSFPRALALSANQIALLFLTAHASLMESGSIAAFNFSFNLQSVPLSVIGVSYSVAAFPTLARLFGNGERAQFLAHITTAARHIIFWSLPSVVLCIVLRAQIVRVVLGSGEFDWSDTRITAAALALFAVSLLAQGLVLLFVRGFYAAGNTRLPLILNTFSSLLVVVFTFFFLQAFEHIPSWRFFVESLLRVEDLPRTKMLMLPLSYSLASLVNVSLLWFVFQRHFKEFSAPTIRSFFEIFSGSVIMGFIAHEGLSVFGRLFDLNTFLGIFAQGFLSGVLGIAGGAAVLWILGNIEMREVWASLHRQFWRRRTLIPENPDSSTLIS